MFNLISVLVLIAVTSLSKVDGQCTFQSPFSGSSWHDNTRGTLTFTSTSMSGWSFTAYGQTISTWECLDSSDSSTLVLRSANTINYSTVVIYAYMCLKLTSITDYSYYYYQQQAQELNAGSERLKFSSLSTLTSADVCDDTIAVPVAEYHVLVKSGSESLAKISCPNELLFSADYTHTATDDTTSCETSDDVWDVCTDTTQMTFDYTTCSQEIAFSSGGKLWCVATVYSSTDPSYPHTVVYNQDATIGAAGNQFACITSDGTTASVAPGNCTATQTPSAFPTRADGTTTMGHTLAIGTKYATCGSESSTTGRSTSKSNTGLIIGMVFLVIIVVISLVTVIICCYIYKRKNRVEGRTMKPMIANGAIARVETIDETMAGAGMARDWTGTSLLGRQTTLTSIGLREKSDASLALRGGAKPKDTKSKLFSLLVCFGKDKGLVDEPMSRHDPKAERPKKAKAKSKAKPVKKGGKTKGKKGIKVKKNDSKKASTEALDVLPPMRREISNVKKSPMSQKRSEAIQPEGGDAAPDGKSSLLPLMSSTPEPHSATAITIQEPPTTESPMVPRAATETDMMTTTDTSKVPSAPIRAVTNIEKGKKKSDGGKSPRTPKKTKKKSVTVSDDTPRQTYPDPNARMDDAKPNLNLGNEQQGKSSPGREKFPPIKTGSKTPAVSLSGIKSSMVQEKGNARDWTFLTCCFGNRSPPSQDGRKKNVTKGLTKKGKGKATIKGKIIDKKSAVSPRAGQEKSGGKDTEGGSKGNDSENSKINGELLFNTIHMKTAMSRRAEASSPPNKTQLSMSRSNTLPIKSVEEKDKPDDKVKVDVYVPNDKTRITLKDTVTVVNKTDKPRSKSVVGTMRASPTTKASPGKKSPRKKDGKSPRRKKAKQGGKKKKSK